MKDSTSNPIHGEDNTNVNNEHSSMTPSDIGTTNIAEEDKEYGIQKVTEPTSLKIYDLPNWYKKQVQILHDFLKLFMPEFEHPELLLVKNRECDFQECNKLLDILKDANKNMRNDNFCSTSVKLASQQAPFIKQLEETLHDVESEQTNSQQDKEYTNFDSKMISLYDNSSKVQQQNLCSANKILSSLDVYIDKILACMIVLEPDLQEKVDIFYSKFPERLSNWFSCREVHDGLKPSEADELLSNYWLSSCPNNIALKLTTNLKKDPKANTGAFFGGFFIEPTKQIGSKLSRYREKANLKIGKAIEELFEALCESGYLEKRIEVLHAFVYRLTQYQAYGKAVEMNTIKWKTGKSGDLYPLLYCAKHAFGINTGYKKDYFERAHSIFELDESVEWPKKPTSRMFDHSIPDIQKACNKFVKSIKEAQQKYKQKCKSSSQDTENKNAMKADA